MMDFSTRCYRKGLSWPRKALLWLLCTFLFSLAGYADGIEVKSADLALIEDGYFLNASFNLQLNSTLEEALKHGVALYFVKDFNLVRPRRFWFDQSVTSTTEQFKLSYNALTRQYRLSVGTLFQNFATLAEAVAVLSRIRDKRVLESQALEAGGRYIASVRMWMDVSLLPKPFQVNALASSDWSLSSQWYSWEVEP